MNSGTTQTGNGQVVGGGGAWTIKDSVPGLRTLALAVDQYVHGVSDLFCLKLFLVLTVRWSSLSLKTGCGAFRLSISGKNVKKIHTNKRIKQGIRVDSDPFFYPLYIWLVSSGYNIVYQESLNIVKYSSFRWIFTDFSNVFDSFKARFQVLCSFSWISSCDARLKLT